MSPQKKRVSNDHEEHLLTSWQRRVIMYWIVKHLYLLTLLAMKQSQPQIATVMWWVLLSFRDPQAYKETKLNISWHLVGYKVNNWKYVNNSLGNDFQHKLNYYILHPNTSTHILHTVSCSFLRCWQGEFNHLHLRISMHILCTVLYTFPKVLTRKICLPSKSFFRWWSFPLFSWP